ncbi:MAG: patatin-like phospholipase family protein [Pseudomonadota bacterium]
MTPAPRRAKLGLALGGGAARGWAHIGVLQVLMAAGLRFDVIAGASIGSVAAAAYLCDRLDELEQEARDAKGLRLARYADLKIGGAGLLGGERLLQRFRHHFGDVRVEDLPIPFAGLALDLATGTERLLTKGPLPEVLRASISLPGIFEPVVTDDAILIDGGLVQPVPVNACRALGAERVVAVDLLGDYEGVARVRDLQPGAAFKGNPLRVLTAAFAVIMRELGRARQAGAPADLMIVPAIGHLQTHDFHKAEEFIALGRIAAEQSLDAIRVIAEAPPPEPLVPLSE